MSAPEGDLDALAAEYVLGTLDGAEAAAVRERARNDAALAEAVAFWQARLAPLAALADPAAPHLGLWAAIEADLAGEAGWRRPALAAATPRLGTARPVSRVRAIRPRRRGFAARVWRDADVWRLASVLALAAGIGACVYAARVSLRSSAEPVAVAALTTPGTLDAAARVDVQRNGMVSLRPLHPLPVSREHSLALWAIPAGADGPVLLGEVGPDGGLLASPALSEGSRVMVTLEPAAGPAPGAPPGATLFAGVITEVGGGSDRAN